MQRNQFRELGNGGSEMQQALALTRNTLLRIMYIMLNCVSVALLLTVAASTNP